MSWVTIVFLAALTLPRVIGHDLRLLHEGTHINRVFALFPIAIWIIVVLWKKVPNPFLTVLKIGFVAGIFLALVHQLTWSHFWQGNPPRLGGNFEGKLDPSIEVLLMRIAMLISSLVTGIKVGVIIGIITFFLSEIITFLNPKLRKTD